MRYTPIYARVLLVASLLAMITTVGSRHAAKADDRDDGQFIEGRIVALGIPGASAIAPVGAFLPGGPIHDNPKFAAFTQPGRVLDPTRILVASTSNFGAPSANPGQDEGSFLSIDPRDPQPLVIPPDFAAPDGQASALGGLIQMFSAQSRAFLNANNNPSAVTAAFTGVSNPLGISINNAFGRLWPANSPTGIDGIGTSTILDPTGIPLAGAPNTQAGGVFAGSLTPRLPAQILPGALNRGALGTAFLGHSPDGSGRAVFAVVLADGSIVQEHTAKAVDGLTPAGTISPLSSRRSTEEDDEDDDRNDVSPRLGIILNYSPTRILYVSEPFQDSIVAIDLVDDGVIFRVGSVRRLRSGALNQPVDLAPAENETLNPNWASNTTLDVGADFYVVNRGNNTIARMRQDGTVVAVRKVRLQDGRPLGSARLNGIAISSDHSKIWVTVTGRIRGAGDLTGTILELPAFEN
ncbi:MAG TPA: hypothetical protein VKJ45_02315 [Blastocatellia bacterium]|nr:hypothetical protein [Blastocatellia bacterium]